MTITVTMDKQSSNENSHPNDNSLKPVDSSDFKPASTVDQTSSSLDSSAEPKLSSFTKDDLSKLADLVTAKLIGSGVLENFNPSAK